MASLNDLEFVALIAEGFTEGSLMDREYRWLAAQTGIPSGITLSAQWMNALTAIGYVEGSVQDRQLAFWIDLGAPVGSNWNDAARWFWGSGGISPSDVVTHLGIPVTYLGEVVTYS